MAKEIWEKIKNSPIFLDETSHPLDLELTEVEQFYIPIAECILKSCLPSRRVVVAVAGPPGSGKTAFASTLTAVTNALAAKELAIMVGLDGWHFPNEYLDRHQVEREGRMIPLRQIKGSPETYNFKSIKSFLSQAPFSEQLVFPVYSREKHDPIPEAGIINSAHRVLILEGNYWLLDEDPWKTLQNGFDLRIALVATPETLIDGLRTRQLRSRKPIDWIEEHIRQVDLVNINLVLSHLITADVVVEKVDSRRIQSVTWRKNEV